MATSYLVDQFNRPVLSDAARDQSIEHIGANLPNSVADVHLAPPADWEAALRTESPKTDKHSWLFFYYYRAKARWVLYDGVPQAILRATPSDKLQAPGLTTAELLKALDGPPPRELQKHQINPFVSDAQHEMWRVHGVYARPFWVLQGDRGGHQVSFSPDQREYLTRLNQPTSPPAIGALPPCPFDGRVLAQLARLNRLYALHNDVGALRATGSPEAWYVEQAIRDREVRELSLSLLEQQLGEVGEMVATLGGRKDTADLVIPAHGQAAAASEALAAYIETGDFIM